MPVGTLPEKAKEIYEAAYQAALEKYKGEDAKERASKIAWGAVKNAGYRKDPDTGMWHKLLEPMSAVFGELLTSEGWVEVATTGVVVDMNGKGVTIEESDFDRWVEAYESGARGQDLPITFDHPTKGGIAAGWFRGLRKGGAREILGQSRVPLLLRPEWTPKGKQSIEDGDYRYFSLEITPDNILRGGSLVNFPAIKGLQRVDQPVALGYYLREFLSMAEKTEKCPKCGAPVPEDADACPACGAKITEPEEEEETTMVETQEQITSLSEQLKAAKAEFAAAKVELAELQKTAKLHESLKAVVDGQEKRLVEQAEQISNLVELNNMLRLHEQVTEFMQLGEHETKIISPAYEEAIIGLMLQLDGPEAEKDLLSLIEAVAVGDAVVELGERGTGKTLPPLDDGKKDIGLKLHTAAVKLSEERNIPYRDALIEADREARNG